MAAWRGEADGERTGGQCDIHAYRGGYRMALLGSNAQPTVISTLRKCMPAGLAGDC